MQALVGKRVSEDLREPADNEELSHDELLGLFGVTEVLSRVQELMDERLGDVTNMRQ